MTRWKPSRLTGKTLATVQHPDRCKFYASWKRKLLHCSGIFYRPVLNDEMAQIEMIRTGWFLGESGVEERLIPVKYFLSCSCSVRNFADYLQIKEWLVYWIVVNRRTDSTYDGRMGLPPLNVRWIRQVLRAPSTAGSSKKLTRYCLIYISKIYWFIPIKTSTPTEPDPPAGSWRRRDTYISAFPS